MALTFDLDATDWQDPLLPVSGPVPGSPWTYSRPPAFPDWEDIERIVIHGTGVLATSTFWLRSALDRTRGIQSDYSRNRKYSIGYNVIVADSDGWKSIEGRGDRFRCAANVEVNGSSIAVLLLIPAHQFLAPEGWKVVQEIVKQIWREAGREIPVVPHSAVGATDCPTAAIRAELAAGKALPAEDEKPLLIPRATGPKAPRKRIRRLQRMLKVLGYRKAPATGVYGKGTRAAVRRLQVDLKVEPTGIWDKESRRELLEGLEALKGL